MMNNALIDRTARYIQETLGITISRGSLLDVTEKIPYHLSDRFEIVAVCIESIPVILAAPKKDAKLALEEITRQLAQLRERLGIPTVYCPTTLASYERRNLIRYRTPFIVPGKQMYLPHLGIDLRERVQQRAVTIEHLSPSTQALLIWSLLNHPAQPLWEPSSAATALGYTPMASSRASRELETLGLMVARKDGRRKILEKTGSGKEIWLRAKPYLRSPIQYETWIHQKDLKGLEHCHLKSSGVTALCEQTILAGEREVPCYAISKRVWLGSEKKVKSSEGFEPGSVRLQIWHYETGIYAKSSFVDPLSLSLSLSGSMDDRILMAIDELLEQIRW